MHSIPNYNEQEHLALKAAAEAKGWTNVRWLNGYTVGSSPSKWHNSLRSDYIVPHEYLQVSQPNNNDNNNIMNPIKFQAIINGTTIIIKGDNPALVITLDPMLPECAVSVIANRLNNIFDYQRRFQELLASTEAGALRASGPWTCEPCSKWLEEPFIAHQPGQVCQSCDYPRTLGNQPSEEELPPVAPGDVPFAVGQVWRNWRDHTASVIAVSEEDVWMMFCDESEGWFPQAYMRDQYPNLDK